MKIDLDWIQEELDAGRDVELECVDRDGFLAGSCFENTEILRRGLIIESVFFGRIDIASCDYSIVESEFKHFRIKQAPTFDDLIDVAVKAYKNRLLDIFLMNDEVITVFNYDDTGTKEGINRADTSKYYQFINFINSLYTETFVIESAEDYHRMEGCASVTLLNGEVLSRLTCAVSEYKDKNGRVVKLSYCVLKGATVTQKRGK